MEYGSEFIHFCQTIYGYQYTQKAEPFNESHSLWLYEHTGGVIALVLALLHDAQEIAILEGGDTLSIAALEAAYKKRYSMIKGNKIVKLSKTGTKKKNSLGLIDETLMRNVKTDVAKKLMGGETDGNAKVEIRTDEAE